MMATQRRQAGSPFAASAGAAMNRRAVPPDNHMKGNRF
jgi:hypothetical protein